MTTIPIAEVDGLRTVELDLETALACDWRAFRGHADVVRCRVWETADDVALRARGFTIKPTWVNWGAALGASEEEFVARLSAKEQRSIRNGRRYARENGLRFSTQAPLTANALEEFLRVYEAQVATMDHGVPYARLLRQRLLDQADNFLLVSARDGDALVGACICNLRREQDAVRVSFAATVPSSRSGGLTRALYMIVADEARARGFRWMSLGSDPSLFGRLAKPGLFAFKSRFGFVPVPLNWLDREDDEAYDVAELVLSLDSFTDPALSLSYAAPASPLGEPFEAWAHPPPWHLNVLTSEPGVDVKPFASSFVHSHTIVVV